MAESPGDRALALLKRLLEHGAWYYSAIELHGGTDGVDGEEAYDQAEQILIDAGLIEND